MIAAARGGARLAIDGVRQVTHIVEGMHAHVAAASPPIGPPRERRARGISGLVYRSVRAGTGLVGAACEGALSLHDGPRFGSPQWDMAVSALNGVVGDHLAATGNPLALTMRLRGADGRPQETGPLAARTLILVHGLCMSDHHWTWKGHDHGAALARDLGYEPLYLRYNTGRHISENGRELADLLEAVLGGWDGELALLGYSMGGLVARSACHQAREAGHAWPSRLRRLVCMGSPHHGAPLERGGHWLHSVGQLSPYAAPLARLGRLRSAGITDLRHGSLLEDDWRGADRFGSARDARRPVPLPEDVRCYALAAALRPRDARGASVLGDGLVPVGSALGRHPDPERSLRFPVEHQWVGSGMHHLDLLHHQDVYAVLRRWLGAED